MKPALLIAVLMAPLAAGGGCSRDRTALRCEPDQTFWPVGIRYAVEPLLSTDGDRLAGRLKADLGTIHRMGLNTVFFRHVEPADFAMVAAAAQRHHLKAVLPDRSARHYVMTGNPDFDTTSVSWLTKGKSSAIVTPWAVDLGYATDKETAQRIERIAALYEANPSLPLTFAQSSGVILGSVVLTAWAGIRAAPPQTPADAGSHAHHPRMCHTHPPTHPGRPMMALGCDRQPGESSATAVRRWLWRFHAGLSAGLTGGLVIDQYRKVPGQGAALVDWNGNVGVEQINAVKRMAVRMQAWGPILDRLEVRSFPAPLGADEQCGITLFATGRRRLLLVFNHSRSQCLRGSLTLDEVIAGLPAKRLVEVPDNTALSLGTVTVIRHGGIKLTLDIAPGDARLYEIF
ncbi:MAG: hypothetical protein KAV82_03105 [Phycisphaerae bacterium]|nr:hypothetical protein [Phycisphaerae bacterium]